MAQKVMADSSFVEIEERDQSGQLVATYTQNARNAKQQKSEYGITNIDIPKASQTLLKMIMSAFLPAGYPQSVTPDYMPYQIYDSLQAFSSSIAGLIASRAVLESVGVGNKSASPTAAILLSVLQSSMGRIATILFAARFGTSLEPEAKMYRFMADILNDTSMLLNCLSPGVPAGLPRVLVLSASSCLSALCGVAAGSSKASLSAHFALEGNLGELNAKDSSQETIISLMGMVAGSFVISHITTPIVTWCALIFLLGIHLSTNYLAVRSVNMNTLNRQRANLVFGSYLSSSETLSEENRKPLNVMDPIKTSHEERIFEWDGVMRWQGRVVASCRVGVPLRDILAVLPEVMTIQDLLSLFSETHYILWYNNKKKQYLILLKDTATAQIQLKAWLHAMVLQRKLAKSGKERNDVKTAIEALGETLAEVDQLWETLVPLLKKKGWDLDIGALETRSGTRLCVNSALKKGL